MGVLACDRRGCENIMCDRGNSDYYICNECFEELVATGSCTDVEIFMDSKKPPRSQLNIARARYNAEFPYRWEANESM